MNNYTAGGFTLKKSKNNTILYYNGEQLFSGCDDILQLTLQLGLSDYKMIKHLSLSSDEINWLEKMLEKAVYKHSFCLSAKK